ncbi:MAG: hypothetical protein KatS3mg098_007 [Candidatus Parcubacteria bacterium]|nr:MAG: hypothetical protein KatS3mg098_007 [Candidatus Parcubacteria bacterium]
MDRFLYALGILHVGQETAKTLAKKFQSRVSTLGIKEVANFFEKISLEELKEISDIGEKVASSIKEWFSNKRNQKFLEKLNQAGIKASPFARKNLGSIGGVKYLFDRHSSINVSSTG